MTALAALPQGARCGVHPDAAASSVCPRCGSFTCPSCERRVRPDAHPMCVSCFDLRARSVPENKASSTALQTAGLVLGFVSLLPLPAIILASLVVNIVGIVKVSDPGARAVRYRPIVGLVLTCLSAAGWLTLTFSAR